MFGIGMPELLIVLAIIIVIFGAAKLPQLGKGIGEGIRNFKKASREPAEIDVTPKDDQSSKDKEKEITSDAE